MPPNFGRRGEGNRNNPGGNSSGSNTNVSAANAAKVFALATYSNPSGNEFKSRTLLDSAATDYCFRDRADFERYSTATSGTGEAAIKDSTFDVVGKGTVTKSKANRESITLRFNNAIHTPQLSSNLISIGRLCDAGYKVLFDKEKALVYDSHGNGFTCSWGLDRLYGFDNSKLTLTIPQIRVFMSNTKPAGIDN